MLEPKYFSLSYNETHDIQVTNEEIELPWAEAIVWCARFGYDWRVPTKDELNYLYLNKEKLEGFANAWYWSSTEFGPAGAWVQLFGVGAQGGVHKSVGYRVRAVRLIAKGKKMENGIKVIRNVTETLSLELSGADIIELLRCGGYRITSNASVVFSVPGGGDYSNCDVDVDAQNTITVKWNVITETEK